MEADVCIVGAGFSGLFLALKLLENGFRVAIVEKNPSGLGESPSKFVTFRVTKDMLKEVGVDDFCSEGEGVTIYGPNLKPKSLLEYHYLIVDRKRILSEMLRRAAEGGAKVILGKRAVGVARKGGAVEVRGAGVRCALAVDASGIRGALREGMVARGDWRLDPSQLVVEHVFVAEVPSGGLHAAYVPAVSSRGYVWWVDRGDGGAEGVIAIRELVEGNPGWPVNRLLFLAERIGLKGVRYSGSEIHTIQRPPFSLVSDALILVGESAFQLNPFFSSGMYESMLGAKIASEALLGVDLSEPPTVEDLWGYNRLYFRRAGKYLLAFHAIARFLRRLRPDDVIAFLDLLPSRVSKQVGRLVAESFESLFKFFTSRIFWRVYEATRVIRKLMAVGDSYPRDPEGLPEWESEVERILSMADSIV